MAGSGWGEEGSEARRASSRFHRLSFPSPPGRGVRVSAGDSPWRGEGPLRSALLAFAPVHVRMNGVWCVPIESERLAVVATLPAPEHSAGAFLFGWLHCNVRLLPSLASLRRSIGACISLMPVGYSSPVVHYSRSAAWGPRWNRDLRGRPSRWNRDGGRTPLCGLFGRKKPLLDTCSPSHPACDPPWGERPSHLKKNLPSRARFRQNRHIYPWWPRSAGAPGLKCGSGTGIPEHWASTRPV